MSWGLFLLCAAGLGAALYLPSLLYLPFVGLPFKQVFAVAPVMTSLTVAVLGILLHFFGLRLGSYAFYGLVLAISLAVGLLLSWRKNGCRPKVHVSVDTLNQCLPLLLSLTIGVAVVGYVYCRGVGDPDAFLQVFDNSFHLSVVKSMSESSDFSVLHVGAYLEPGTDVFNPDSGVGFYPACWHIVAALLVQVTSIPVAAAINVTNFVFLGMVLPLGIQALVGEWTEDDVVVCFSAAIVTLAFTAFPWALLYWGPVYPNLAAFCAVPAVAAVIRHLLSSAAQKQRLDIGTFLVALFGICCLVLLQPNSIFTLGIWLIPAIMDFAIAVVGKSRLASRFRDHDSLFRLLIRTIVLIFIALVWLACYRSSFMSGVVAFTWPSFTYLLDAIRRVVTLCFNEYTIAIPLAAIVIIGCWRCLCDKRYSGFAYSFLFASGLFIVDAISDGALRHILTGFWYTDQYRVAAMAAMFGIPVAALGLSHILNAMRASATRFYGADCGGFFPATVFAAIVVLGLLYWPENVSLSGEEQLTPIGSVKKIVGYMYSIDDPDNNLTGSEAEFLLDVKSVVGDGLVINNPYDGSCYGYALDGLNLMYRKFGLTGKGESENSVQIRKSLNEIAHDLKTRESVEATGAQYVLLLDSSQDGHEGVDMPGYTKSDWVGIDSISDDTEGFELVLSVEDMKLYKICP